MGPVLAERGGLYRVGDSSVPNRFINSPEGVQAALNAGAQPTTMQDALVADLRRAATNPDGTLNVGKYQTWLRNRGGALQNFPDLQQRLGNAATAQEAADTAAASAKAQTDAYQHGAARYFLNAEPRQAVAAAFGGKTPAANFAQFSQLVAGDADAKAGLQRAIVDHMLGATQSSRLAGNTGVGELNPEAFQRYLATNRPALAAVFTPDQLSTMDAVAADLQRANLSITGNKIPGTPGTAQDLAAARSSLLGNIVRRVAGATAGYAFGGLHGAIEGALGGEAANAIRRAGIDQINKLVEDALLNPERARALLADYSPKTVSSIATRVRNAYGATTLASLLTSQNSDQQGPTPAASPLATAIAGTTSAPTARQPAAH